MCQLIFAGRRASSADQNIPPGPFPSRTFLHGYHYLNVKRPQLLLTLPRNAVQVELSLSSGGYLSSAHCFSALSEIVTRKSYYRNLDSERYISAAGSVDLTFK